MYRATKITATLRLSHPIVPGCHQGIVLWLRTTSSLGAKVAVKFLCRPHTSSISGVPWSLFRPEANAQRSQ